MKKDIIFCFIGASGSGKTTIINKLNPKLKQVVSYRDRPIRKGEVHGKDGYFVSTGEMLNLIPDLIAYTKYRGFHYGVTQGELLELEEAPMLYAIDYEGSLTLEKGLKSIIGYQGVELVRIYIKSDKDQLRDRMLSRGDSENRILSRLSQVNKELLVEKHCNYVIENKDGKLEEAVSKVQNIIIDKILN